MTRKRDYVTKRRGCMISRRGYVPMGVGLSK